MKQPDFRRFSYRTQMFVGMLLASLAPLCIIGAFSYKLYTDDLAEKLDVSVQQTANQVRDRMDTVLTAVKDYYVELPNNPAVSWLYEETGEPTRRVTELKAAIRQFGGIAGIYEYVYGYSFINRGADFAITSGGIQTYSKSLNYAETEELILDMADPAYNRMRWHNNAAAFDDRKLDHEMVDLRGYLLVLQLPLISTDVEGALIVNLNGTALSRLLTRDLGSYNVVALDQNGELFMATNPALADYCVRNYNALQGVSSPVPAELENGEKRRVAVAASKLGMTYIVSYDENMISEVPNRILEINIVLSVAVALLVALSGIGTAWLYRPVRYLTGYFSGGKREDARGNEIERITNEVGKLVNSNISMERVISSQREMLAQNYFTRLFRGELTSAQIAEQAAQLKLETPACYCVLACRHQAEVDDPDSVNENALCILFIERLPEVAYSRIDAPPLSDHNVIIFLLGADDEEALAQKTEAFCKILLDFAEEDLAVRLHIGVSSFIGSLGLYRTAFLESVEALKSEASAEDERGGRVSYYSGIRPDKALAGVSIEPLEKSIRIAIDQRSHAKADRCLQDFIASLPGWAGAKHENALRVNRFITAILMVVSDAGLSLDDVFAVSERTLYRQAAGLYDGDQLRSFFMNDVIEPCISALETLREDSSFLRQITAMVEETSGNITIAECSERLGYHQSYIWRILKTHTGLSFAEYTTKVKLSAATKMLMESEDAVGKIAEMLSYTNAQNFIRFFSKHMGVTPGKYRQMNRGG